MMELLLINTTATVWQGNKMCLSLKVCQLCSLRFMLRSRKLRSGGCTICRSRSLPIPTNLEQRTLLVYESRNDFLMLELKQTALPSKGAGRELEDIVRLYSEKGSKSNIFIDTVSGNMFSFLVFRWVFLRSCVSCAPLSVFLCEHVLLQSSIASWKSVFPASNLHATRENMDAANWCLYGKQSLCHWILPWCQLVVTGGCIEVNGRCTEKQTEFDSNTADTTVWRQSKIQRHNDHSFFFWFLDCCSASTPAHSHSSAAHQLCSISTQFLQASDGSVCLCCTNASADLISSYSIPNVRVSDLLCVLLVSNVHNLPTTSVCASPVSLAALS